MNRRDFLSRFGTATAATGVASAAVVTAMREKTQAVVESDAAARIRRDVDGLTRKLRTLEKSNRRLTRALVAVVCMSTGLDAVAWIRGDIL